MVARIGVVGTGMMGAAHARILNDGIPEAAVVAVSDSDRARAQSAAATAGDGVRVVADPHDLITDPGIDAVVIATTDETHEGFVLACLSAGKPVLCEKPLATTATASLRIMEEETALGRRLVQVGFMRRYDPAYALVKREVEDGAVGRLLFVHCAHRNASVPPTFTSEMLITSSVTHEIDAARWLTGQEVVAATVYTPRSTSQAPAGLKDPQFVVLETRDGVLIDIEIFVNARYGYEICCELVGEHGTVAIPPAVSTDFRGRFAQAYKHELRAWVTGIANGGPSGPSAWDGYAASAVADACLASLASGAPAAVGLAARPALYA
jgi:myo-inositol 2-dehydrogenase/D-chiro-inositol 1-dehydrogenase